MCRTGGNPMALSELEAASGTGKGISKMKYGRTGALTAIALVAVLAAQSANAQSFRVEGQAGVSQFHSEGNHHSKFGIGAAAGVDFNLGGNIVAGAEGTYWS